VSTYVSDPEEARLIVFTDVNDFTKALENVRQGQYTVLERMRLGCSFHSVERKQLEGANGGM
jgi:NAD kinase